MVPRFVKIKTLAAETGLPVFTLRRLRRQKRIPFVELSPNVVLFEVDRVTEALRKLSDAA
jgi:hypothetical protein